MDTDDSAKPFANRSEALVRIGNYGSLQEAAIVRGVLLEHGIPAVVQGGEMATALSVIGTTISGVGLEVPQRFAEEASGILDEQFGSEPVGAWKCPKCGADVDAGFEACWQCSTPFAENSAATSTDTVDEFPGDEIVDRAWRSTIIGFLLCGVLVLYGFVLTVDAQNAVLSESGRRKLKRTQVVALLYFLAILALIVFSLTLRSPEPSFDRLP